jgi:hypothetical protein
LGQDASETAVLRLLVTILFMAPLSGCLAGAALGAAGAVVGTAVKTTGVVVGTAADATGAVIDAAIPGEEEDEKDDDD